MPSGSDVTFTIVVTNTGDVDLINVTVSDPSAPNCDRNIGNLRSRRTHKLYLYVAAA